MLKSKLGETSIIAQSSISFEGQVMAGIFDEISYYLIGIFLFVIICSIYVKMRTSEKKDVTYIQGNNKN